MPLVEGWGRRLASSGPGGEGPGARAGKAGNMEHEIILGPLKLETTSNTAYLNEKNIMLTPKEFLLLHYFVINKGRILSSDQIYEAVWGYVKKSEYPELRKHISTLRKKLGTDKPGFIISAKFRKGYCFTASSEKR
jgi:DNA-binding response OmpR family regulator